jgi:hypothetical protein
VTPRLFRSPALGCSQERPLPPSFCDVWPFVKPRRGTEAGLRRHCYHRRMLMIARLLLRFGVFAFALVVVLGAGSSAYADTVFFSNRTAWELAVGSGITTETFQSYPWGNGGGNNLGVSTTLGSIRYDVDDGYIFGNDSAAITYDDAYLTGQYLEWQNHVPNALHVTLPVRTTAVGFDYGQFYGTIQPFLVSLGNGDAIALRTQAHRYAFFGAVSTDPLTRFTLTSPDYPLIDNLSYGGSTSPVPESGTFLLFATGAAAIGLLASRRRQRGVPET